MQAWKLENFATTETRPFPRYRAPTPEERGRLARFYVNVFGELRPDWQGREWQSHLLQVTSANAGAEEFDLQEFLLNIGLFHEFDVAVKWSDNMDDVDVFSLQDLCEFFDDIWYPSTDDIEIVDMNLKWMLAIDHHGYMWLWRHESIRPAPM